MTNGSLQTPLLLQIINGKKMKFNISVFLEKAKLKWSGYKYDIVKIFDNVQTKETLDKFQFNIGIGEYKKKRTIFQTIIRFYN